MPADARRRLLRPRELEEEPDRTLRLHPMPHFRNDDRARCRTDLERAVDRWTDVIAQHPADHVDPGPYATPGGVLGPDPGRNRRLVELRRPAAGDASVGPLHPVAAHAIELGAQHRLAPGLAHHPRTAHEGRTVAYVLAVGAIEISDPVPILVEVKAGDRALHRYTAPCISRGSRGADRQGLETAQHDAVPERGLPVSRRIEEKRSRSTSKATRPSRRANCAPSSGGSHGRTRCD